MDRYDVCLSFAGADRGYVAEVATLLQHRTVKYFYDADRRVELWGENLQEQLAEIYGSLSQFCVMFISQHYLDGSWTLLERRVALSRARKVRGPAYVLPVLLDDVELPAELGDAVFIDGRQTSPEDLADLICAKLRRSNAVADSPADFSWHTTLDFRSHSGTDRVLLHQQVPVSGTAPHLSDLVRQVVTALGRSVRRDQGETWWTHHDDRRFDRVYATATVVMSLLQVGVPADSALLGRAMAFLRRTDPAAIDDRAATVLRLVIHDLTEDEELAFIAAVRAAVIEDEDSPLQGSMLLPQAPIASLRDSHWISAPMHASGAAFHACHIGEALLGIPEWHTEARAGAREILNGIRRYLIRTLENHDGWLVDVNFRRTPQTLYAYSVLPGMAIPLPARWLENAEELFQSTSQASDRRFRQFLQVSDAWYLYASVRDRTFRRVASEFAQEVLGQISSGEIDTLNARDLAALLRAVVAACLLVDERLSSIVTRAAMHSIRELEMG